MTTRAASGDISRGLKLAQSSEPHVVVGLTIDYAHLRRIEPIT